MKSMHGWLGLMTGVLVATGCPPLPGGQVPTVRPGLEVLLSDSLHLVRGKRVGLLTNQAGVDAAGVPGVQRLRNAGVQLVALFSPEHGFPGTAAPGADVPSTVDSASGLPIYSLYGRNSERIDSVLGGIDLVLVDLQDAGARYYTWLWTTVGVMRAAGARRIPVIVLDRPNPIGGTVQGNVLDTVYRSAVGMLAIPMRHGMTLGELTRLARLDLGITVDLVVVPAAGWHRQMYLDDTGLPFIPPSPNLRSVEALIHYPGLCLFEGTALSVGRGSDAPFEQVGAPWLDTLGVLADLSAAHLEGVEFHPVSFTPRGPGDGKYADTTLAGIRLRVTDRASYDPTLTAVTLLAVIQRRHPNQIGWAPARFDRLAGGPTLRQRLMAGEPARAVTADWDRERSVFEARRLGVLVY